MLTASLSVGGVGVVSGAHEAPVTDYYHATVSTRLSDRQADIATLRAPADISAASADITVDSLARGGGVDLFYGLSRLTPAQIPTFFARYPGQVDKLLAEPPKPEQVATIWQGIPAAAKEALRHSAPRLVGNLDGISLRERGRANIESLSLSMSDLRTRLAVAKPGRQRDQLGQKLSVLTQIREAVRDRGSGPIRSLVLLDTSGSGRAAIALGNPDTADYVSYLIPGMNYTVHDQIVNWSATADALYSEQRSVLNHLGARKPAVAHKKVATIAWIGYEAPDLFSVGGLERAEKGADFLERSWLGLKAFRNGKEPVLSVFAHSYGSTVTLVALSRNTVEVDALVMVGSPGSAVQSARDLPVAHNRVYVGEADWDPAVNSAFFGSDPGGKSYGARPLGVSGARDRITGARLDGSLGHNEYFKPGSESLHNMALIGTGNAKLVTNGSE